MEDIAGIAFEPAHRRDVGVALHHADIGALARLPREGRLARHRPLHAAGQRHDRKQHIVPRHHEIMDHAGIGRVELVEPSQRAGLVDHAISQRWRKTPARRISEENHFAGLGIDFRMRSEAGAAERAVEVPIAMRRQGLRIERERAMPFLQRKQLARVPDDIGVGDAAVLALSRRVGGCRIAPAAEQRPMRLVLQLPFRRAHPAIAIADSAIGNVKSVDHAVADEPVMVMVARRELRIGTVAVERPGKVLRQFAAHRQIGRVGFEGERRIIAAEERIGGKRLTHVKLSLTPSTVWRPRFERDSTLFCEPQVVQIGVVPARTSLGRRSDPATTDKASAA